MFKISGKLPTSKTMNLKFDLVIDKYYLNNKKR